jgi:hypothetical protein
VRAPKQRVTWIPRPPESASRSTADFIVAIFAITVATILIILTIGISFAGIRGKDISTYFAIITSIMTSIISALVGFLAGKGAGQAQASQQQPVIVVPPAPPEP